jgi:gamma-glutamyltranspeptidase
MTGGSQRLIPDSSRPAGGHCSNNGRLIHIPIEWPRSRSRPWDRSRSQACLRSSAGYLAVGVPGSPAGFEYARQQYGTFNRESLMAPAIRLAKSGFILEQGDIDLLSAATSQFKTQPNVAAIFLKNGQPHQLGDRLVQRDLAETLRQMARGGPADFYRGSIADKIVAASNANDGILSKEDFEQYSAEEHEPVLGHYRGFDIISSPPPSSGGTIICEILNILSGYPMADFGYHSAKSVHYMVEAMRKAYVDRTVLGDPDFVQNPLDICFPIVTPRRSELPLILSRQHHRASCRLCNHRTKVSTPRTTRLSTNTETRSL